MKPSSSHIGKRGYVIVKSEHSIKTIELLKKELTVTPFKNGDYGETDEPFSVFLENSKKMYIPKYFGIEKFGQPVENHLRSGDEINLLFNGLLRPHQIEPIEACIQAFSTTGGGILSLPCGEGKTACACYLISKMKKKTFVLVHKEFLMNQWIERISGGPDSPAFLPGARIGRIQGKIIDIENKDIVIGMIQSISMKEYPLNTFDSFGMVILDESHRCPSREFSKALQKINCQYMLGLSATPNRKDGLTKVLKWYIGEVVFSRKGKSAVNSLVERYIYECDDTAYCEELTGYYGKVNSAGMINNVALFMPRTLFIVKQTLKCLESGRQILILADRREMLKDLELKFNENGIECGYYIGGMKQVKLDESVKKAVILATFQMAAEGLDIKTIDTIILGTPKTDIEQAVGRIRPKIEETKNIPLVIDIVDNFSLFERQAFARNNFYKKKNYEINTFSVSKDGEKIVKLGSWTPQTEDSKTKCTFT
jgi:superfamily II DNA or RNA helicase